MGTLRARRLATVLSAIVVAALVWSYLAIDRARDGRGDDGRTRTPTADASELVGATSLVQRVGGEDGVASAVAVSARFWERASHVVIAPADRYAEALLAGPLARALEAPILLVPTDEVPTTVVDELARLGADEITLVGDEDVLSAAVAEALVGLDLEVSRVGGDGHLGTSAAVATALVDHAPSGRVTRVALVDGSHDPKADGYAEALAVGTFGRLDGVVPTLLVEEADVPDTTLDVLDDLSPGEALLVGGPAAIGMHEQLLVDGEVATVTRLAGVRAIGTAVATATEVEREAGIASTVLVASDAWFYDALVAAALTARLDAPVLLVPPELTPGTGTPGQRLERASAQLGRFLRQRCGDIDRVLLLGSEATIADEIGVGIEELLRCPRPGTGPLGPGSIGAPAPSPSPSGPSPSPSVPSPSPSGPTPTEPTPTEPAPTEPTPSEPTPSEPTPSEPTPSEPTPTLPTDPPEPGAFVVPLVVGDQQGTAITKIVDESLNPVHSGSQHSDSVIAGRVISQFPLQGTEVAEGTGVAFIVSLGPPLQTIPDVVGREADLALQTILNAGFAVGRVTVAESDDVPAGHVAAQLPLGGTRELPGTPVDLVIAAGPVNRPPRITSEPSTSHTVGGAYTHDATATDPDDDPLTWRLLAGPAGAVIGTSNGRLTWTPTAQDAGTHDLVIEVADGRGGSDVRSWTVTVRVPNRAPVAADDAYQTRQVDEVLTVPAATGVLANDDDPDGDPITAQLVSGPSNGTLDLRPDGSFIYRPTLATGSAVRTDIDLVGGVGATATASSNSSNAYTAPRLLDGILGSSWFSSASDPAPEVTITFDADVTVRRVRLLGNREFANQGYGVTRATLRLVDADGATRWTSGPLDLPEAEGTHDRDLLVDVVALADGPVTGVRAVVIEAMETANPALYPGLAEIDVWGDGVVQGLAPVLEWEWTEVGVEVTPSVADLDGDGVPEIISTVMDNRLLVFDGATGTVLWEAENIYPYSASPVVADLDPARPGLEIVVPRVSPSSTIVVFDKDGNELLEQATGVNIGEGNLAVADLDGDGRPEIIVPGGSRIVAYTYVPGATPTLEEMWRSPTQGCGANAYRTNCIPVVADIDLDGVPEVIAGDTVYSGLDGSVKYNSTLGDGWVALGNFDDDPQAEIVLVTNGQVYLLEHDLTVIWGPVAVPNGGGGAPTVADFDGDGRPEIGIAGAQRYVVFNHDGSVLWQMPTVDLSSARTGSTVFDFDNDGVAEVVYRDEQHLWLFSGPDGTVRAQIPVGSSTTVEAPIVADVDGDGQAEIVVTSDVVRSAGPGLGNTTLGIKVYGGAGGNWVRARPIWNQHTYHVTNINADGTVPRVARLNWLTHGLNHFRQNAFLPDEVERADRFTYRVSDGTTTSATATVLVDLVPPQNAPQIVCLPEGPAVEGLPFHGRICAIDADDDDLTYAVVGLDGPGTISVDVAVPGSSNPWLAGMPDGTTTLGDNAPTHSPVLVTGLGLVPGSVLTFDASGLANYVPSGGIGPDGHVGFNASHSGGALFGIANVVAPTASLVGVFLEDGAPDGRTPPAGLDFGPVASRDFTSLAPALRQPFFIGDGVTSDGVRQEFVVPAGATRLYFGIMDGFGWYDNSGQFDVTITTTGQAVEGLVVDGRVGTITWTPQPGTAGLHYLVAIVTDATGRQVSVPFQIEVVPPVTTPDVVGHPRAAAEQTVEDAGLRLGEVHEESHIDVPAGSVIRQTPPAGASVRPGQQVWLVVSTGRDLIDQDRDGDGFTPREGDPDDDDPTVYPGAPVAGGPPPGVTIDGILLNPVNPMLVAGTTLGLQATAYYTDASSHDVRAAGTWSTSDAGVVTVDRGVLTGVGAGTAQVTVTYDGASASRTVQVFAPVVADHVPPTVRLVTPAEAVEVSAPLEVVGTVTDANLVSWRLGLFDGTGALVHLVAEGATPRTAATLGTLDPTLLFNGSFVLRLEAEDAGGNTASAQVDVQIEGEVKVGTFSLTFRDLLVPVSGLPLAVSRHYDSRDTSVGEFGRGWRLGLSGLRLSMTPGQGEGWYLGGGGWNYHLQPTRAHTVTITLPDGSTEVFDLAASPSSSSLVPLTFTQVRYVPRQGTRGRLAVVGNTNVMVFGGGVGEVELVDDLTFRTFEPTRFVYTAPDGTAFRVTRDGTVEQITDATGATITVSASGITHSRGRSVAFERDALGRITAIVDPEGGRQTYGYDAAGNLIRHTDLGGNSTRYRYTQGSKLLEIIDPLGRVVDRREYDDDGRLVAITGPNGERVAFEHDLDARREVMTDPNGNLTVMAYDEDGNVLSVTNALGGVVTHTYDGDGNQTSTTDEIGRTTTRTFNPLGLPLTVTDPAGGVTRYAYDTAGRLTSHTDPTGAVTTYTYDARGNLTGISGPGGVSTSVEHNGAGVPVRITDPTGAVTQLTADAAGMITGERRADGRSTSYTIDRNGAITATVGYDGATTTFTNDAYGAPVGLTSATGVTASLVYTAGGHLAEVVDALGNRTGQEVDALGRVLSETDARGGRTTYTYTPSGQVATVTAPNGGVTTYTYDELDRQVRVRDSDGTETTTVYDAASQVVSIAVSGVGTTTFAYDAAGRVTSSTGPDGATTATEYDAAGRPVRQVDPSGGVTTWTYDDAGRIVRTDLPDGTSRRATYDAAGRTTSETDGAGRTTTYSYDVVGNLVEVVDPAGGRTRATYDAEGRLLSITDAIGQTTRWYHDADGRLNRIVLPGGATTTIGYDIAGRATTSTDPNGIVTRLTLDARGEPTLVDHGDGTTTAYVYDAAGRVTSVTEASGTTTYGYTAAGQVASINRPDGSRLTYVYGAGGVLASVTARTPDGTTRTTSYGWNDGELISVTSPAGVVSFDSDLANRRASTTHPNGVTTTTAFDPLGRVVDVTHERSGTVLGSFAYERDANGDVTQVTDATGARSTYAYDTLRRLVSEVHRNPSSAILASATYTYDAVGNRTSATDQHGVTTVGTYVPGDRLVAWGATTVTYDAAGNQLTSTSPSGTAVYGYDGRGRMTSALVGTSTVTYGYDHTGARTRQGTTGLLADPLALSGVAEVVAEYGPDGAPAAWLAHAGNLLHETRGATTVQVHGDALGSTRLLTSAAGAVTDTFAYTAFGDELSRTGTRPFAHRYTGERLDAVTGLYHLRAREYDPATGRLTARDPVAGVLEDPVTRHPYQYGRNAPLTYTDPTGLTSNLSETLAVIRVQASLGAGIGGLVGFAEGYGGEGTAVGGLRGFVTGALYGALAGVAGAAAQFGVAAGITASLSRSAGVAIIQRLALSGAISRLVPVAQQLGDASVGLIVEYQRTGSMSPGIVVGTLTLAAVLGLIGSNHTLHVSYVKELRGTLGRHIRPAMNRAPGQLARDTLSSAWKRLDDWIAHSAGLGRGSGYGELVSILDDLAPTIGFRAFRYASEAAARGVPDRIVRETFKDLVKIKEQFLNKVWMLVPSASGL